MSSRALAWLSLAGLLGCVPDLDSDESTVVAPRVLAVVAQPAEARAGEQVTYTALVVDRNGERSDAALGWFYCEAQKPLSELGPVSPECLTRGPKLKLIGRGPSISGSVPGQACALFGPNLPQPEEGQAPGRPVDADQTGGFQQPVVLGLNAGQGDSLILYEQRLRCDLAGVTPQLNLEYALRYHANENPALESVKVTRADGSAQFLAEGDVLEVEAGERVTFDARWAACPEEDECGDGVCGPDETRISCSADCGLSPQPGCKGRERYLWFDNRSRTLEVRRESMRVAWYATAGVYEDERTGVEEEEQATRSSKNVWTAPTRGDVKVWLVVRDARGGTGTLGLTVQVR